MRRELTWQAVVTAVVVAALISASYPYVLLKLGIGPNVSVVSAFLGAVGLLVSDLFLPANRPDRGLRPQGGDATGEESWPAIMPVVTGNVLALKASHHGRKTGYYGPAVKKMAPWLTITSVGEKEHDATESYRQYSEYTVSLRKAGDIRIIIEDDGPVILRPGPKRVLEA